MNCKDDWVPFNHSWVIRSDLPLSSISARYRPLSRGRDYYLQRLTVAFYVRRRITKPLREVSAHSNRFLEKKNRPKPLIFRIFLIQYLRNVYIEQTKQQKGSKVILKKKPLVEEGTISPPPPPPKNSSTLSFGAIYVYIHVHDSQQPIS